MFLEVVNFSKIYEKIQQAKSLQTDISNTELLLSNAISALTALSIKTTNIKKLVQDIDVSNKLINQVNFSKNSAGVLAIANNLIDATLDSQVRPILGTLLDRNITSSAVEKGKRTLIAGIKKEVAKYGMKSSDFDAVMKKMFTPGQTDLSYLIYSADGYLISYGIDESSPVIGVGGNGGESGGTGEGGGSGSGGTGEGGGSGSGGTGEGGGSGEELATLIDAAFYYPNYYSNPQYLIPTNKTISVNLGPITEPQDFSYNPASYFSFFVEVAVPGNDADPDAFKNKLLIEFNSQSLDGSDTLVTSQSYASAVYYQTSRYVPGQDPLIISPGRYQFQASNGNKLMRRGSHTAKILYSSDGGNTVPWTQIGQFLVQIGPSFAV